MCECASHLYAFMCLYARACVCVCVCVTYSLWCFSNYMHQLVKTHPVSNEYILRKQAARWGRHSNGYIEFALQVHSRRECVCMFQTGKRR